jgi:hypothetical protein
MHLAQVEQFVYNAPSPWWTVGTGIGTAFLAGIFATIGWYVIHRNSRTRDQESWRRTTLVEATTDLLLRDIELHTTIVSYLYSENESDAMEFFKLLHTQRNQMTSNIIRFEAANSEHVLALANKLSTHYKTFIDELPIPTVLEETELEDRSAMFDNGKNKKPATSELKDLLKKDLATQ